MQHDAANPIEEPMNDANAAEPASVPPPTVNRRGAAAVLVVIVVVLAGFFGYVAMAPKGKPADGTLPMDPIGFAVPDLRLPTLNKPGELGLRDLVGKPVVINFWASWCVTCKEEAAIMGDAERKWRDKGVVFIGIDASDKDDEAKKFEALYGMDYESLVDRDGVVGPNWGVTGYPETFFVGRDGRIVSKFISAIDAATLDQRILEILNS
jgi:cytochrome c biogenesis protein CcmG/thiol:disulfide interchange protein DsbE